MKVLLDTCTFLWLITNSPKMSHAARECCMEPANELFLSPVSAWEISVKHALGRLTLRLPPSQLIPLEREHIGAQRLPLRERAVLLLYGLPDIHKDPFDRMLICQAIAHDLWIVTPDQHIKQYPVRVLW